MIGTSDAVKQVVAKLEELTESVVFYPIKSENTHDLLHAFMFVPGKQPEATCGSLKLLESAEAQKDLKEITTTSKGESDITEGKSKNEESRALGLAVTSGPEQPSANLGVARKTDLLYDLHFTGVYTERLLYDLHFTGVYTERLHFSIADFIVKYVCDYAENKDPGLRYSLANNSIQTGSGDFFVGFMENRWGALCERLHTGAKGSETLGLGANVKGIQINAGVGRSSDKGATTENRKGIFAASFWVVHLRKEVGDAPVQLISKQPLLVYKLDDQRLLNMFEGARPPLRRVRDKKLPRFGRIFRPGNDAILDAPMDSQPFEHPSAQPIDHEEAILTFDDVTPMFDNENNEEVEVVLGYKGSWNLLIKATVENMAKLRAKVQRGTTKFRGITVKSMTRAYDYDLSAFLPIYFNLEVNRGLSELPSDVLCYSTDHADHWCLRPANTGADKKEVVTMYDEVWEVRESIVIVKQEDADLQNSLGEIGFCVLQDGEIVAHEGFVVMGRHELTRKIDMGTGLSGINIEFYKGYLRELREVSAVAAAASQSTNLPGTTAATTNPAIDGPTVSFSPSRSLAPSSKKAKLDEN
jgi:hypothetical protein